MADKKSPIRIVVLGAGGNSLAIVDAIIAANTRSSSGAVYDLIGFLDDIPENRKKTVLGFPVIGTIDEAQRMHDCRFINGIASVHSYRKKPEVISRTGVPRERFETIVHPSAVIGAGARVGAGSAIMANSVICPEAAVGDHVIILQCSTLNHHSTLGDFVTVSAGVTILGAVEVGTGAFIGGGVSIAPYVCIGDRALVGMGSTVIRNVEPDTVVAGNPAHRLERSRFSPSG